jgi:polyhydroxybutyrate depolymerase
MPGWQKYAGDQSDRDLAFFDAMLKTMIAEYQIDENRIYACGHSNGGYFCYVLLPARGDVLAAVAPIAAALDVRNFKDQKPKPVFHVAGERDPLVKYAAQEKTIEQLRKLNGCDPEGKTVGKVVEYTSKSGPPVVVWLHSGGHEIPAGSLERITEFFQQHTRK